VKNIHTIKLFLLAAAMLFLNGCSLAAEENVTISAPTQTWTPVPSSTSKPTEIFTTLTTPAVQKPNVSPTTLRLQDSQTVEIAMTDLASRLDQPITGIRLVKTYADEFPLDNLGCPDPSLTPRPIPALVSGEVIILEANGDLYAYHVRKDRVVFCGKME
jgi:hypothetical protein